jgi:hypothetical protein
MPVGSKHELVVGENPWEALDRPQGLAKRLCKEGLDATRLQPGVTHVIASNA